jgi:L-lactate dehydrogenase complex protein LldG
MNGTPREVFLENIHRATAIEVPPHQHETEMPEVGVGRSVIVGPITDAFAAAAVNSGMVVHRIAESGEVPGEIERIAESEGVREAIATPDVIADYDLQKAGGINIAPWDASLPADEVKTRAFDMECGITGVDYAVAETGSLVLVAKPDVGRSVSLLGRVHIAVVVADEILPDLYDLFDALQSDYGDRIPPNVSVITGPSKTADIELSLVIGVHGPAVVHVVLVG